MEIRDLNKIAKEFEERTKGDYEISFSSYDGGWLHVVKVGKTFKEKFWNYLSSGENTKSIFRLVEYDDYWTVEESNIVIKNHLERIKNLCEVLEDVGLGKIIRIEV